MKTKINYAVVGLGHIAQTAVLPSFKHAPNSRLAALVSGDPTKLKKLGKKYGVKNLYSYGEFREGLLQADIDVVYICTPNTLHRHFAEIAAAQSVHVLSEKPLATTVEACLSMIKAAREAGVKLMTAYRLHFDAANLEAMRIASSGQLGELRVFSSTFTMQVRKPDNIRLKADLGGGTLYDIGIYCINAARYLFREEPVEVYATTFNNGEARFNEVDEATSVILRFSKDRVANFVASFGAADSSDYDVIGTRGRLRLKNAYDYATKMELSVTKNEKTTLRSFPKRDQFAPELVYFSDCILKNKEPEPSGVEGLADIQIIQALLESIRLGQSVRLDAIRKSIRPKMSQKIVKPAIPRPPRAIHASNPH